MMEIIYFCNEDRNKPGNGVSQTKRGKIIIPRKSVPVGTVWLCNNKEERGKVILVTPIEEVKVEAGILLTLQNGEVFKFSSNYIRSASLEDLFFPNGDRWWKGELARCLENREIIKTILLSAGGVKEVENGLNNDWELNDKNTVSEIDLSGVKLSVIFYDYGEIHYLRFSGKVQVGFYLSMGPVSCEKGNILKEADAEGCIDEIYFGFNSHCEGLKHFWENITGFGSSRAIRIALNSGAKSDLATYALSKTTGGPGWIEMEGSLMDCLTEYYGKRCAVGSFPSKKDKGGLEK